MHFGVNILRSNAILESTLQCELDTWQITEARKTTRRILQDTWHTRMIVSLHREWEGHGSMNEKTGIEDGYMMACAAINRLRRIIILYKIN